MVFAALVGVPVSRVLTGMDDRNLLYANLLFFKSDNHEGCYELRIPEHRLNLAEVFESWFWYGRLGI